MRRIIVWAVLLPAALFLFAACAEKETVTGQWRTIGRSDMMKLLDAQEEIWYFSEEGVAAQYWDGELISSGTYELADDGTVTIKFFSADGPVFTLDGNELLENGVAVMVRDDPGATPAPEATPTPAESAEEAQPPPA